MAHSFYLTDHQLGNSPSRRDGIDEEIRRFGCGLIQVSGILLKLPQAVMATGQVLLHRFYCKRSFARFDVKIVAASCVWLASKLEECPRKARQVLIVFHRIECRWEKLLPIDECLDLASQQYSELKFQLIRAERHVLKEMGFACHVEHPHKFISNYLATLGLRTQPELTQYAWNLANDSLRTTLCVRFRSEVVACSVVYLAARRFGVPLPENPPWWKVFDADKSGIDQVCSVLAHLYSQPKANYISVCQDPMSFTSFNKSRDSQSRPVPKLQESSLGTPVAAKNSSSTRTASAAANEAYGGAKDTRAKQAQSNPKEPKKSARSGRKRSRDGDSDRGQERDEERDRGKDKERKRQKSQDRDIDIGVDSQREREQAETERVRDRIKDRSHRSRRPSVSCRSYRS